MTCKLWPRRVGGPSRPRWRVVRTRFGARRASALTCHSVRVYLSRETDGRALSPAPISSRFPTLPKPLESYWIVVGCKADGTLLGIKRINTLGVDPVAATVQCTVPDDAPPGTHHWSVLVMNDTFVGCDQEYAFSMDVEAVPM